MKYKVAFPYHKWLACILTGIYYLMISCNANPQLSIHDLNKSSEVLMDSSGWFSIDSLPGKIKPYFRIISSTNAALIISDKINKSRTALKRSTTLQMGAHKFEYVGTHELSDDPADNYAGDFLEATLSFDSYSTLLSKCTFLSVESKEKVNVSGFSFSHNEKPSIKKYSSVKLNEDVYYLFTVGPAGCGTCGDEYTVIIKESKHEDKFYILENGGGGDVVSFENWFWGDINNDGNLDVYLLYHFGESQRDGKYDYLPFSIINDSLSALEGYPKFHFDFLKHRCIQY